jgi:hypothetical protein
MFTAISHEMRMARSNDPLSAPFLCTHFKPYDGFKFTFLHFYSFVTLPCNVACNESGGDGESLTFF